MTFADTPTSTLTRIDTLIGQGYIPETERGALGALSERYAIAVPPHLADLIDKLDPADPIARQVIPSTAEGTVTPEERADPIGDDRFSPVKGLVHRYPDRVLLKLHSACAMYCRFCFRRETVGPGGDAMKPEDLESALDYIRGDERIWEVILTGGDPLVTSPVRLKELREALDAIPHVQVVRFHTRLPVAAPERVTAGLIGALTGGRATVYVAVHTNHARELTADAVAACARLTRAGIPLVGQTVLLKGVNDDAGTLADLFRAMVTARITPYYLHHPDLAQGTSHFRVGIDKGQALMRALRGRVSGLALPAYMLDIPGGFGKVPVGPAYLAHRPDGAYDVEDIHGTHHRYPPLPAR
jgi:lysine 2,3-aminomutase